MQDTPQLIEPINVTGAAFIIQLFLVGILVITIFILRFGEKQFPRFPDKPLPSVQQLPLIILGITSFCFATLLASEDVISIFGKLFNSHLSIGDLNARTAPLLVFLLDILLFGILIYETGGSKDSPFISVLFVIPSLSIFLRENPERVIIYTFCTGLVFLLLLIPNFSKKAHEENPNYRYSFAFVTIACFALSVFIGYITRPVPTLAGQ